MKQTPSSPVSTVMQESFGCAVENRFYQLLDDESDPFDLLYQAGVDKTSSKKDATTAKKNTNQKANKKESQKNRKDSIVPFNQEPIVAPQTGQKRAPKYGEKIGQNENLGSEIKVERAEQRTAFREFRPNIIQKPLEYSIEKPVENFDKDRQIRNVGSIRGGMRGRGRGGFQRNTDFDNQRGKREFERHSGSDRSRIRAEDKRGGSGPHNWGSIKDDFSEIEQTAVEDQKDSNETQEPTEEPVKMEEEIDEVAQEMTLDEWKSIQEQSRPKPDFNLRKPDTVVPSKAVVIHKAKYRDNLKEDEDYQYCFRKPVNDITSQLDINFGSLTRPSRGRGGRGRARKEETFTHEIVNILSTAPNPDDPEDFPALI